MKSYTACRSQENATRPAHLQFFSEKLPDSSFGFKTSGNSDQLECTKYLSRSTTQLLLVY
jgi:hypothetical protein